MNLEEYDKQIKEIKIEILQAELEAVITDSCYKMTCKHKKARIYEIKHTDSI